MHWIGTGDKAQGFRDRMIGDTRYFEFASGLVVADLVAAVEQRTNDNLLVHLKVPHPSNAMEFVTLLMRGFSGEEAIRESLPPGTGYAGGGPNWLEAFHPTPKDPRPTPLL